MSSFPSLRSRISDPACVPFLGVYDVFSATLAAKHADTLFLSGFGLGASHHGMPDCGFIGWEDVVGLTGRILRAAPGAALLVDIDDGFGDKRVAAHVGACLSRAGAFGVVLEDQRRPKRCGHLPGKEIVPLADYLEKLSAVRTAGRDLFVIARTDASDPGEIMRRLRAFEEAGADAVLADGLADLDFVREITAAIKVPVAFNQIHGGKSAPVGLAEMERLGLSLAVFSTPLLFAAQQAMEEALAAFIDAGHDLAVIAGRSSDLHACNDHLENVAAGRNRVE